jgi:rhomboid protease GluP
MDKREAIGRAAWAAKPVVTAVLAGAIVLCFALEYVAGGLKHPFGLVRYGANAPVLVADGQLFRLVAANFLHANLLHTYLNAFALYVLGMLIERLMGPWRFLLIYLMGAIGGAVASTLVAQAAFSVGASTAVFGLLAALGVINWHFRADLPGRFRQPVRWWMFVLGLNTILPVLVPQIDVAAHVGGFVIGGLATAIICRRPESIQRQLGTPPLIKWASLGLTGLFAIGLVQAAVYARQPVPGDETRVARAFVAASSAQPEALNAVAWAYATDPHAATDQLDVAQTAVERALQSMPDSPPFLDSLATVYFRRGQLEQAIATERQAIDKQATQFYVSQIGRFLEARQRTSGPLEIGAEALASRIRLTVEPRYQMQNGKRAFLLEIGTEYPRGMVLYALAKRGHAIQGVLWVVLGPNNIRRQYRLVPAGKPFINDWSDDVDFEVVLVDTSGCDCTSGSWRWRYWSMDREVLMLP